MYFRTALRWLGTSSVWTSRALLWSLAVVVIACASVVLTLRYWLLPNIERYRDDIAAAVSRAADLKITIGRISGDWDGMRPHLKLEEVAVYDRSGRRALELTRVDSTISWRSLATFRPQFHALDIYRPQLDVRRDESGALWVAGLEVRTQGPDRAGFAQWLLDQPDVEVHEARVTWTDELRRAPPLVLNGVSFQLANRGSRHRVGLVAHPPVELAGPIDLRADARGDSSEVLAQWNGRLFLQLEKVDLAAWSPWIDVPFEVTRGAGALRTWLTFEDDRLSEVLADVHLASVRARLREELPELDLASVAGRVAWRHAPEGIDFSATGLRVQSGETLLEPTHLRVRLATGKDAVQQGEVQAKGLDLGALVMLADRLPLENAVRGDLMALAPRGRVHEVEARWKGAWPEPRSYSVRGRFEALAFSPWRNVPGLSGLSGNVDATEKGGSLHVTGESTVLEIPERFAGPLPIDTLTGQLAWSRSGERIDLKFSNVSFANVDAAGTLFGTYRTAPQGPGEIDLTAALTRADASNVARYIPVTALRNNRAWFERAFVAGRSNDVRVRLKGRLDEFPFAHDRRGIFHVAAKITGGILDYHERWPRIENIEGDLQFRGPRMELHAKQGTIYGVKLSKVHGEIPDTRERPATLTIAGEAEGPTADFLAFVAKSPVSGFIDHYTDAMQAQGTGKLALKLVLPFTQLASSKVAGSFQLVSNTVIVERDLPPLEFANGKIEFTENSARASGVTATFLGGPVTINGAGQKDGPARVTFQGRVNADNVRKAGGPAWMQQIRGSTDWRGALTLRKKVPELVIESNLQGIASSLPAPFDKAASETIPMRLERRVTAPQQDRVSFSYGDIVKAELARRTDGRATTIERGNVRLGGGEAGEPERRGVWLTGTLKRLDFDDWLAFSRAVNGGETAYTIAGADVKFGSVDFFDRRLGELSMTMRPQGGATQLTFAGRDLEGTASWRGEGRGRLAARLKRLTLPAADTKPAPGPKPAPTKPPELPALDVVVDDFQHGAKQLGKLELNAVAQERDWRIERLRVSNPDVTITADGVWQAWLTQPRTQMNVKIEVADIGKALVRWGYPPGIRRGTAKIEGPVGWAASPYDFDTPSLSGQLVVEAANGQFVKLEPGLGKLFGILSLQSLPRRISLDFRDVFSEGFAFDTITGSLKIDRGVATTENFRLQGPAARVVMTGQVDLARETQKLRVRVAPQLAESVAIAGALVGGPVAGVAAYLAQKILKDPLENLITFEYNVTGSWAEPQVAKAERASSLPALEATP